ncbi:transglycosylase SLT domain-containing protein [Sphingomonas sp. PWP1-2]|uniref:lytic transglycosylase domain-containing protein n=1 Tax=Sphingomonas sp. PWP1-2 TaxID=2804558 RepID=UPI003CEA2EDA
MRTSLNYLLLAFVIELFATGFPVPLRAAESDRSVVSISAYVTEAAKRFAIPEAWIYAVMRVESSNNPRAVSPKGATGLMQIMPATWRYLRARYGLADNVYDPRGNIFAGAAYMRELYDRYGAPGFLAAYNAGPARYEAYVSRGRPLPAETIGYVAKLAPITTGAPTAIGAAERFDPSAWTRSTIFVSGSKSASVAMETKPVERADAASDVTQPPPSGLFVALSGQHPQ